MTLFERMRVSLANMLDDGDATDRVQATEVLKESNMAVYHAIERTSPKGPGHRFIGTCRLCGTTNLPASAALQECPNQRGLTQDEALIETITGEPSQGD